ncbi:MAG: acyltransferase [Lachnospiraceae bacterium]|nr:acyltransferase [Lachnospiraceae bacterium]
MSNQRTKSNKKFMILSAIGIFMVVDSHTFTCFNIFGDFLPYNSFFMPMFVFISGYFNKVDSSTKLWPYFIKKVRTLLVPYTGISLAVFGIQQLINRIKLGDEMPGLPSGYFSYAIDRVLTDGSFAAIATPMWFVISLFATLMVYAILKKLLHRIWNSFLMFALFAALHILVVYFAKNSDPESIKYLLVPLKCMFLMPFLELGVIYRNHIEKKHTAIPVGGKIGLMFALLVINAVRTFYLPNAYDLAFDRINDLSGFYSPYYVTPLISSLVGILFWLTFVDLIAKPVGDSRFVNYMSCNTFWIMGFHILFFNILNCVLMLISTNIVALPFFDIEAFQGSEWYYWEIGSNAKCLYVLAGICGPLFFKWVFDKISSPVRNKYNDIKNASAKSAKILSGIMYALMALIFAVLVITFVSGMRESVSNVSSEYETETAEDFSETFPEDEDGYLQDNITPAYAFLHIVYEDGESYADYFSEFEEVYEDGTYIITVNRSDDPEAELVLAGISYMGIKLIQDDDAEPNISDAIITDISVTCDGEPISVEDNAETVSGDDGARYIYFDCYDMESDAASLSVTFTVSGTVNK